MSPKYLETFQRFFFEIVEKFEIPFPQDMNELSAMAVERGKQLLPGISKALGTIISSVFTSTISILTTVLQVLLIPIIAFYLLVSFENIKSGAIELLPIYTRTPIINKFGQIDSVLASFVRGQLTISFIMAVLYSIGFTIIGIDLALVIGIVSGLLFIVPYLGTMIALLFGPAMAFAKFGDLIHVFYVLAWIGAVQIFESYVLTPKIVGQAVGLHPVVYILALIIGGNLFGFVGMLVAIPVAAVSRVLLLTVLEEYKRSYLYHDKPGKD
jgi:predicted PurR-regulated permease PerM